LTYFRLRPSREHTELEEELHSTAHIDYDRVAIVANPSVSALYEDALVYETGTAITSSGALTAYSGSKTGRSPLDKRVVKEEGSEKDVWWGPVNKPMSPEVSIVLLLFYLSSELVRPLRRLSTCHGSHHAASQKSLTFFWIWCELDDYRLPFPAMQDDAVVRICSTDRRETPLVN
jgi:hypothetical protein